MKAQCYLKLLMFSVEVNFTISKIEVYNFVKFIMIEVLDNYLIIK